MGFLAGCSGSSLSVETAAIEQPPIQERHGLTGVWTGEAIAYWGGGLSTGDFMDDLPTTGNEAGADPPDRDAQPAEVEVVYGDGALLDLDTLGWQYLPPDMLSPRTSASQGTVDGNLVVWGGRSRQTGPQQAESYADGGILNLSNSRWRELPESDIEFTASAGPIVVLDDGFVVSSHNFIAIVKLDGTVFKLVDYDDPVAPKSSAILLTGTTTTNSRIISVSWESTGPTIMEIDGGKARRIDLGDTEFDKASAVEVLGVGDTTTVLAQHLDSLGVYEVVEDDSQLSISPLAQIEGRFIVANNERNPTLVDEHIIVFPPLAGTVPIVDFDSKTDRTIRPEATTYCALRDNWGIADEAGPGWIMVGFSINTDCSEDSQDGEAVLVRVGVG